MCTMFSNLQSLSAWTDEKEDRWKNAVGHLNWVVSLYQKQIDEGRLFLHEHPISASSWKLASVRRLENQGVCTV